MLLHPGYPLLGRHLGQALLQVAHKGTEMLGRDAHSPTPQRLIVQQASVVQHVERNVAQVFLAQALKHHRGLGVLLLQELIHHPPIAARLFQHLVVALVESRLLIGRTYLILCHQAATIGAYGVDDAAVGLLKHSGGNMPIVLLHPCATRLVAGRDGQLSGVAIGLLHTILALGAHPYLQIAIARGEGGTALGVGGDGRQGVELRIVVKAEVDGGVGDRRTLRIDHPHPQGLGGRIGGCGGDLVALIIVATDEHGTAGGPVEPTLV